jgi:tetratricopeptide (TPR) repeat protein
MVLFVEPHLLRRFKWRGLPGIILDFCFSFVLIVFGVNVALLRGPWLLRKYGIRVDVTLLQYLTALGVFGAIPYLCLLAIWPGGWWFPLLACGLNFLLAMRQTEVSPAAGTEAGLLAKIWRSLPGNTTNTVIAPGLIGYYVYIRLIATVAWLSGQQRFVTVCVEELSAVLDYSETFDLAEDCLAVATKRATHHSNIFGSTRLEIRTASLWITLGRLKEAAGLLKDIPRIQVKNDETRRWSAFQNLTEARIHQEQFKFERALHSLENAKLTLRLRLSGSHRQSKKAKAHLAQLLAHTAEQRILLLCVLSRFDEAFEAAKADAETVADYGDSLRNLHFAVLAAFMQTLAGANSSAIELIELDQRLSRIEQELHPIFNRDTAESNALAADHTVSTRSSSNTLLEILSQNHSLLSLALRAIEFQRATIMASALFARCRWQDGSLHCFDRLARIKFDNIFTKLNGNMILRAIAFALGGEHDQALETLSNISHSELLPAFNDIALAVLRSAIEWDRGSLHSAITTLQDVTEQVLGIGFHYAAFDVRAALVLINDNLLVKSVDVTLFLCLLGPVLFLWNIGIGLMRFEQERYSEGTPKILNGLEWLEDRRVFIETSQSVVAFKSRYGWLYDLATISLLNQKHYADALRLSERLRCMTLLVLNHYQALDLAEVPNWALWKSHRRITKHLRELLDIAERHKAERRRKDRENDAWFAFLRDHFEGWTPDTVAAELLRLIAELDYVEAGLRREHPKFRQLQATLLLQRDPIPTLDTNRAILGSAVDSHHSIRAAGRVRVGAGQQR